MRCNAGMLGHYLQWRLCELFSFACVKDFGTSRKNVIRLIEWVDVPTVLDLSCSLKLLAASVCNNFVVILKASLSLSILLQIIYFQKLSSPTTRVEM